MVDFQAVAGTQKYVSAGMETDKGVAVARGELLPISAETINTAFNILRKDVQTGDRLTEVIVDILKGKVSGTLTMSMFATAGMDLLVNSFGNAKYLAAVASQTTAVDATTANNQSIITLPSVTGYTPGRLFTYGTPPNQEFLQVMAVDTVAKTLTVKRLKSTTVLTAGQAVASPGQHDITIRQIADQFSWSNPTHSVELNRAFQYAWLYAGTRVLKSEFRATNADVELVHTIMGTEDPVELDSGSWTMPQWTTQLRQDVRRPFTIRRCYAMVPNAQHGEAKGSLGLTRLVGLRNWSFDWDNTGVDQQYWDGDENSIIDSLLTKQKGTFKYQYANSAARNAIYDEFLWNPGATPVPFFITMVRNRGTALSPNWIGVGTYAPATQVTVGTESWPNNDAGVVDVEADIVTPDDGSQPLHLFVVNDKLSTYLASGTLHP